MNSKQLRKKTKKKLKGLGIIAKKRREFVNLKCIKCNRQCHIQVNDKSVYTDKIIKKWICLLCK